MDATVAGQSVMVLNLCVLSFTACSIWISSERWNVHDTLHILVPGIREVQSGVVVTGVRYVLMTPYVGFLTGYVKTIAV
jgi:hypothetical protein